MKTKSLGFIGGGRITRIFLQAFANRNCEFQSIMVYDTNSEVTDTLQKQFPQIEIAESLYQVSTHSTLFIALHPPVILETLDKISDMVSSDALVISLAPRITIEKIGAKLKTPNIARMIPNATSYINEGYNPITFAQGFNINEKEKVLETLNVLGHTFEVDESKLEGYALLSAMLPTYFWFQWKELSQIGTHMELTLDESSDSVYQTLLAALHLLYRSGLKTEEVMDLIPVKPIAENQTQVCEIYQSKLLSLYERIKP